MLCQLGQLASQPLPWFLPTISTLANEKYHPLSPAYHLVKWSQSLQEIYSCPPCPLLNLPQNWKIVGRHKGEGISQALYNLEEDVCCVSPDQVKKTCEYGEKKNQKKKIKDIKYLLSIQKIKDKDIRTRELLHAQIILMVIIASLGAW